MAAAPLIATSLLAPDYQQSFAALLVGFALSEAWRAPAAIMIRDVSPTDLGSTGSALHLCIRNLIGGLGPLGEGLCLPALVHPTLLWCHLCRNHSLPEPKPACSHHAAPFLWQ